MAEDLCLKLQNGTQLYVPNRLDAITTYVILEQERWFEKEWGFIEHLLRPGMVALDIGANLGIFSMAMAKAVGSAGTVYAYEPTSDTRARLERSKAVNGADNLDVIGSALSDTEREGRIVFGASSELNRLGEGAEGQGEAVHLTSLDLEKQRLGWGEIDFIKMDAEGEELKIIAGGKSVFEAGAPVVMFEIKSETGVELGIGHAFQAIGYRLYRLLPDERHLVPYDDADLDGFELNVFAIKPERVAALAEQGLLAEVATSAAPGDWQQFLASRRFGAVFPQLFDAPLPRGPYADGLAAYAGWRDEERSISQRYAALRESVALFEQAVAETRDVARLLSLARARHDSGHRTEGNRLVIEALQLLGTGQLPEAPFLPPTLRHEMLAAGRGWLETACLDVVERNAKYSTFYGRALDQLGWVCDTPFSTYELERRRVLSAVRRGQNVQLRKDLGNPAPDHLNAEAWAKLIG